MRPSIIVLVSGAGVGGCAALGVGLASWVVLGEPPRTGLVNGLQAGVIAALVFLGAEYVRRRVR